MRYLYIYRDFGLNNSSVLSFIHSKNAACLQRADRSEGFVCLDKPD